MPPVKNNNRHNNNNNPRSSSNSSLDIIRQRMNSLRHQQASQNQFRNIMNKKMRYNKNRKKKIVKSSYVTFILQAMVGCFAMTVVYLQSKLLAKGIIDSTTSNSHHRNLMTSPTTITTTTTSKKAFKQKSQQMSKQQDGDDKDIVIDIISIGSKDRYEYMETQQETWGSHPNVRHFLKITEDDDDDPTCSQNVDIEKAMTISRWCRRTWIQNLNTGSWVTNRWSNLFAHHNWLTKFKGPYHAGGWICAQKRFMFGITKMMNLYNKHQQDSHDPILGTGHRRRLLEEEKVQPTNPNGDDANANGHDDDVYQSSSTLFSSSSFQISDYYHTFISAGGQDGDHDDDEEKKQGDSTILNDDESSSSSSSSVLPDYLILVDDDTFMNIGLLIDLELRDRSTSSIVGTKGSEEPYVAAGCRITNPNDVYLAYGGFGTIFSKGSLQRLSQPIFCNHSLNEKDADNNAPDQDERMDSSSSSSSSSGLMQSSQSNGSITNNNNFTEHVCNTISQNLIHEKSLFEDGMSVYELFDARARFEKYTTDKDTWSTGFCFHGDHYMAVMIEQYHLSQNPIMEVLLDSEAVYLGRGKDKHEHISGNCLNDNITHCDPRISTACHRQNPKSLHKLHKQVLKYRPEYFTRNNDDDTTGITNKKSTTMFDTFKSYFWGHQDYDHHQSSSIAITDFDGGQEQERKETEKQEEYMRDQQLTIFEQQHQIDTQLKTLQDLSVQIQDRMKEMNNLGVASVEPQKSTNKKKRKGKEPRLEKENNESSSSSQGQGEHKQLAPNFVFDDEELQRHSFFNVTYNADTSKDKELIRFSPPDHALEAGSLQIDSDWLVVVGGYKSDYTAVSNTIHFFNIKSQKWIPDRTLQIPEGVSQTHQGLAFDESSRFLYIVSGQVGGGCSPATTKAVRIHIDTGSVDELPPLPASRYYPGLVVVPDPTSTTGTIHLHAFGGASTGRIQSARNHWRLILDDQNHINSDELQWQELEPVIDGGTHGRAFHHEGSIYYTAFCDLDQTVFPNSENMGQCQKHAFNEKLQLLHHTVDAGLTMVYPTEFSTRYQKKDQMHWARLPDMPFPACHTGMSATSQENKVFFLGGGYHTPQTRQGSPPTPLDQVQVFDLELNSWYSSSLSVGNKKKNLHNMVVWVDHDRNQLYGLRSQQTLVVGNLTTDTVPNQSEDLMAQRLTRRSDRSKYLKETRKMSVDKVTLCIDGEISKLDDKTRSDTLLTSVFDEGYDDVRSTWNRANLHLQYPDIVAYPQSADQISAIVKCAKKTGYHVCGRNGKHSFEGDTCTYGIVIDVSNINDVKLQDYDTGTARFGAGLTLGRASLELSKLGLDFPVGHCATVGLTGLMLVGGQGILSRHFGMTVDYVSAIDLVDESGDLVHATETNEYADYLWLARGGGSGVQHFPGIITAVETTNLPKIDPPEAGQKMYSKFDMVYEPTVENAVGLIAAWQDFYLDPQNVEDPLFSRLTVEPWLKLDPSDSKNPNGPYTKSLYIACYFYGNDELHKAFVDKYLETLKNLLPGGQMSQLKRLESLQFRRRLAGVVNNNQLASGHHGWDLKARWKGYSAVANEAVPKDAFRVLAENIFDSQPYSRRYVEIKPLGGAIRNVDKTGTAFWHRDAIWWLLSSHFFNPKHSDEEVTEIKRSSGRQHHIFIDKMGTSFSGMYSGYIDRSNSTGRDLEIYYGGNAQRISEIKMSRDPHNLFRLYRPNSMDNRPFNANEN